jgi:peptidylprolyl isomerase
MIMKNLKLAVMACLLWLTAASAQAADPANTLYMDLPWGRVVIEMLPDIAPKHVARIKELVRKGFYDGTPFHRVIDGFMAQGGDPTGTGTGGSGEHINAEFTGSHFTRGVVGMARSALANSADSQFFIMLGSSPSLDGKYTVWGQVIEGMENVDKITKGNPAENGLVEHPDKIVHMSIAGDKK